MQRQLPWYDSEGVIDLSGNGDDTLQLSLGDVLAGLAQAVFPQMAPRVIAQAVEQVHRIGPANVVVGGAGGVHEAAVRVSRGRGSGDGRTSVRSSRGLHVAPSDAPGPQRPCTAL